MKNRCNMNISKVNLISQPFFYRNSVVASPSFKSDKSEAPILRVYSDSPIRTNPAQLSVFALHDFHGQNLRMERAYTIANRFDNDKLINNTFFDKDKPVDKLKLASGDMFLGENEKELQVVNEFLNIAGITATAVGNHECDDYLSKFSEIVKDRNYKFLAANMHPKKGCVMNSLLSDSFIVESNGNKYGILGLAPIDLLSEIKRPEEIEACNLSDYENTIKDIKTEVSEFKKQGVNKIILLSHTGLPFEQYIAQNVSDIDLILGGHSHNLLKEVKKGENLFLSPKGEPVLIVQVGRDGENVAIPNLQFNDLGQITSIQYNVIKTDNYPRSKVAKEAFEKILGKSDIVGTAKYVEAPPEDIYIYENPHCNFILDCMMADYDIDIALTNSANIRSRFYEGDIDTRDLIQITPFGNKMTIAKITEEELVDALDDKIEHSLESPNHRPGIIQVGGLRYEYSKSKKELTKLTFIDRNGVEHPIDIENPRKDKFYTAMADDYCFINDNSGLDLKHRFEEAIVVYDFDKNKIVEDYLRKHPEPVEIKSDGRIKVVD